MLFDRNNPEHVNAEAFMAAVEAEEPAQVQTSIERSLSGVDGPAMPYEEFLRVNNLPGRRTDSLLASLWIGWRSLRLATHTNARKRAS